MTTSDWVTIVSVICAVAASLIGGTWILSVFLGGMERRFNGNMEALRKEQDAKLMDKVADRNKAIAGIGASLDRHKDDCKKDFLLKEVCHQMHLQTKEDILRIEKDNKEARHEMNATVAKIFLMIENLNTKLEEFRAIILKRG